MIELCIEVGCPELDDDILMPNDINMSWADIRRMAVNQDDDHVLKFTYTAMKEVEETNDDMWRLQAARLNEQGRESFCCLNDRIVTSINSKSHNKKMLSEMRHSRNG